MALQEARYYHSEIVRLKGEPRAAVCRPCEQLEKTMVRVKRNSDGTAHRALKGREEELAEVAKGPAQGGGDKVESTAQIESDFDAALSKGERARIKGERGAAARQEARAESALRALDARELPHGDKLVKREMSDALASFARGVRRMPRKQQAAQREGAALARRVAAEARSMKAQGYDRAAKVGATGAEQAKEGSKFVDHLLYGKKGKATRAAPQRSQHAGEAVGKVGARAAELRRAAQRDDGSRGRDRRREEKAGGDRAEREARGPGEEASTRRYEDVMGSSGRREELRRVARDDRRRRAHVEGARRRMQERRGRRRVEGPAEREGRGWEGRIAEERREAENEGEHLPAYRKESWQKMSHTIPHGMLERIYGHFSRS